MPPTTVAILVTPYTTASVAYGMYDLFMSAGRDWGLIVDGRAGPALMQPFVVSSSVEPFTAANDVRVTPQRSLEAAVHADIVCIPEVLVPPGDPIDGLFDHEVEWLRRCHARGAVLAATCSVTVLLAETGLLNGCDATTHWAYCEALSARHPRVNVLRQAALVASGEGQRLVMAGGGTTWLDLALFLIARTAGIEVAMQVARLNLIDWHATGQQPFARLARTRQADDAIVGRCQEWIGQHYRERSPVAAMVRLSGLAERSFNRRFKAATGLSPLEYVHTLRLEDAKHQLETSDEPIEAIAENVGYEDAAFLARLFRRKVDLTPAQYRRRFRGMRNAIARGRF
jgi:transcriptional regulator GlxA family with amidase domain